ncbi:MAG: hypothetical protein ABUS54_05570 [Actinomycetota bacterium]
MADIPDRIVLERDLDVTGRHNRIWLRRAILGLLVAFLVLGAFDVFGQRPQATTTDSAAASVELSAPTRLRGGLLWQARFTITAHREIRNAVLQLSPGWQEGMQMNTIEPSPLGQGSRDGDLLLTLGHIPAGKKFRLFMEFQVNATNVGRRRADATLYDGGTKLVQIDRRLTVFP